jgi:hypothetical protein
VKDSLRFEAFYRHHAASCVLVELSKEGDVREDYRHRMFQSHSCKKQGGYYACPQKAYHIDL